VLTPWRRGLTTTDAGQGSKQPRCAARKRDRRAVADHHLVDSRLDGGAARRIRAAEGVKRPRRRDALQVVGAALLELAQRYSQPRPGDAEQLSGALRRRYRTREAAERSVKPAA